MTAIPLCPKCGKQHEPSPILHLYQAANVRRTRRRCPYHKRLCYGERQEYYDTIHVFFDCGTSADYGYGVWREPPEVTRTRRRAQYAARKARQEKP